MPAPLAVVAAVAMTAAVTAVAVVVEVVGVDGRPPVASAAVRPCSNGLVALTFDDGPSADVTPRLLEVLTEHRVPATFFMVGERVASARSVALSAYRRGFVIANHTYGHEYLPSLSNDGIRATLRRTAEALRSAGIRPSKLMRPPYGAIDSRVTSIVEGMGLTPVLWTVDSRNWESGTAAALTTRVLSGLRPGRRNNVLLHDGVARSSTTLAAVPAIIRGARTRGYCFAELGPAGTPVPPVPGLRVSDARVEEADRGTGARLTFDVTLDRPTSRPVSVQVRTKKGTAAHNLDYRGLDRRIAWPAGTTTRQVTVRVRGDNIDERVERLRLRLHGASGLKIEDRVGLGTIVDDDPRPNVALTDTTVTEPSAGSLPAVVGIVLDRPRSRKVVVVVGTRSGVADETDYEPVEKRVVIPAGERRASVPVPVLADALDETEEVFELRLLSVVGARAADGTATVTIAPPPEPTPGG